MRAALEQLRVVLTDSRYFWHVASVVIAGDALLTFLIIKFIAFTEIDFATYMHQVAVYQKGERNYSAIEGPSGPLVQVYPAGHVHIHDILSIITHGGENLRLGQHIYGLLYLTCLFIICCIYRRGWPSVPNYTLLLLPLSKRLHSIYVLRLFNDCWASTFAFAAVWAVSTRRYGLGSFLFSVALSVKMNALLYFPGLAVILVRAVGLAQSTAYLLGILGLQLVAASPFLLAYPREYLTNAFDLSREFLYVWTVNWRFVPEPVFLSKTFARTLMVGHLSVLILFGLTRWCQADGGVVRVLARAFKAPTQPAGLTAPSAHESILILFTSNLIGVVFARSLHYQFYSWYAHTLPFLAWSTSYPPLVKVTLLFIIEYAWNVFPSTNLSSVALLASHVVLVGGLWLRPVGGGRLK